jgi:hypothetical protein
MLDGLGEDEHRKSGRAAPCLDRGAEPLVPEPGWEAPSTTGNDLVPALLE